nr:hypothetical protein [Vibrio parahaemolyticus]
MSNSSLTYLISSLTLFASSTVIANDAADDFGKPTSTSTVNDVFLKELHVNNSANIVDGNFARGKCLKYVSNGALSDWVCIWAPLKSNVDYEEKMLTYKAMTRLATMAYNSYSKVDLVISNEDKGTYKTVEMISVRR